MSRQLVLALAISTAMIAPVDAAEVCGNGLDDDSDGLDDEGCFAQVCESPLSCNDTGMVSPLMGALRFQLPPDVAPQVPYGSGIGMRRFYTSMYSPAAGSPVWKKPMGERWQHTYSTWMVKTGSAPTSTIVLHTNRGQDVRFTFASTDGVTDSYTPQTGVHVKLSQTIATGTFQVRMLTGETLIYNSVGRLTEIWDTLAAPNTNKVLVTYDGAGQVSTVTDASGKRRLLFAYASSVLTSVQFQIFVASWTTHHTTTYAYTSGRLTTVTIGGALAQTNLYTSSYLTKIQDAASKNIITIAYNATAGTVARLETPQGTLGFEYASTRAECSGKTVLHFNLGNASTCSSDAGCGTGFLCGGKTATGGSTGRCFRAARCLTTSSPSEDVVTTVTPLGPPGQTCDGACTDVAQYVWNTGTGVLDLKATQDPAGNFVSRTFDSNGLPTQITTGDPDTDAANGNGARTEWRFYGDTNYPGKLTEIRRKSDLAANASSCSGSSIAGCAQTLFTYYSPGEVPSGKLKTVTRSGYTLNVDNAPTGFSNTTTMSYDSKGRPTLIDGPLAGSNDVTAFTYWPATGALSDNFLDTYARKKDATNFLEQRALTYDFWGNPTLLKDVDTTVTCLTFDTARGYLKNRSEAMAGQSDCTVNGADLVTKWSRDSALRLVQLTRPDNSCMFFEYDANGRLQRTKRRDDCVAASAGDRQEFLYDTEGLLTEIQTYDAASVLTAKQPFTYFDSRRLEKIVNPVDLSKWTGIVYDTRGLVNQLDGAGALGKTVFNRAGTPGAEGRVTSVDKYKTSSTFDTWSLLYAWLGELRSVTDGDAKVTQTVRDDLGREVNLISPDITNLVKRVYDPASRVTQIVERYGAGADQRVHNFTFDNLGRPLDDDFAVGHSAGTCGGSTNPAEIQRVYDAPPPGTCPISGGAGCLLTAGRLAWVKTRLMCSGIGADFSLDQETFYAYDAAGRVVVEYIRDDGGRIAIQQFSWTKNGDLLQMVTPTSITMDWSYGSVGSNSDTDLLTAQSRNGIGNPITTAVLWNPYGPLKQYNQQSTLGGVGTRTRISRNLAYRITQLKVETTGGTNLHSVDVTEDAKGRVLKRDYTSAAAGVLDSFFLYDDQDRLLCETTTAAGSCPTSGSTIKNSHTLSPPFTNAGDWKRILRPIPGSTGLTHEFNAGGSYGTSHRVTSVNQTDGSPVLGNTTIAYHADGDRDYDVCSSLSFDVREFDYDSRHNLTQSIGYYRSGGFWYVYIETSAFDDKGRRVYKSFKNNTTGVISSWYFYYDPLDRLTEVRFTPSTVAEGNYQVFQLAWLRDRLTGIWQSTFIAGDPNPVLTKRYVSTDETNRPLEMWVWPPSGDTTRAWAINPSAWGFDTNLVGPSVFQPVLFAGQYQDTETAAYQNDGTTVHRPGMALNGFRTYDPFTGSYLQVDPLVPETWSSYGYCESDPVGKTDPSGLRWCDYTENGNNCGNPEVGESELDPGYCPYECIGLCASGLGFLGCDCNGACSRVDLLGTISGIFVSSTPGGGGGGGGFPWGLTCDPPTEVPEMPAGRPADDRCRLNPLLPHCSGTPYPSPQMEAGECGDCKSNCRTLYSAGMDYCRTRTDVCEACHIAVQGARFACIVECATNGPCGVESVIDNDVFQ